MKPTVVSWEGSPVRPSYSRILPWGGRPAASRQLVDVLFPGPVEHRRDGLEAQLRTGPAQVRLQNLADVHTAGHAQRIEHDLQRRAVRQERHVLHRQDLGDHTLVAVPAGHLVADGNHAFGRDVDLDHLQHAAAQFVAALHAVELAVAIVDGGFDIRPARLVDLVHVRRSSPRCASCR